MKNVVISSVILILTVSNANLLAAPRHIAHHINSKTTSHAHLVAAGERFVATGDYDTRTLLLKAISVDNHFAWIKVAPSVSIVCRGKLVHADAVQEGDKLLCQGMWKGSDDNRSFYASQIKVIGQISYMKLHDKIAIACQSMTQDGSGSAAVTNSFDVSPSTTPAANVSSPSDDSQKRQAIRSYCVAESSRIEAVDNTRSRLLDLIDKIELDPDERSLYQDKYFAAINEYTGALNRLRTIPSVPLEMDHANQLLIEACAKYQGIADLARSNYGEIVAGDELGRTAEEMKQYILAGNDLSDQSSAEAQKALDKFFN